MRMAYSFCSPVVAVVADQPRLVGGGIFAEPTDRDHRVEQRHVRAERQRRGLFGRPDDAHLLRIGAREIVDDDADDRIVDEFAQPQLDVVAELRGRLADRGQVGDQRRRDAAIGAHLDLGAEFGIAPDEDRQLVERADDIFLARPLLLLDERCGRQFGRRRDSRCATAHSERRDAARSDQTGDIGFPHSKFLVPKRGLRGVRNPCVDDVIALLLAQKGEYCVSEVSPAPRRDADKIKR